MTLPPSVLVYGRDKGLLETRRLVLETAGFKTHTVESLAEAEKSTVAHPEGLLVLCHSLSLEECQDALLMAHSRQPGRKRLIMTAGTAVPPLGDEDELLTAFHGPKTLVDTVRKLLEQNRAGSAASRDHRTPSSRGGDQRQA